MRIEYSPHLVEAVVRRHVDLDTDGIARTWHSLYGTLQEAGLAEEERLRALRLYVFRKLGLHRPVLDVAGEFPGTPRLVRAGPANQVEGCFLAPAGDAVLVRLRPERFEDGAALRVFLRHEWRHVADMVDPAFGYPRDPADLDPPVRDRYALLWGIHCDARTVRAGKDPLRSREEWRLRFDACWSHAEEKARGRAFDWFWDRRLLTHGELVSMARDPGLLIQRVTRRRARGPGPGARCPLCGFPTFAWVVPKGPVARKIRRDFRGWTARSGACERCAELYELRC